MISRTRFTRLGFTLCLVFASFLNAAEIPQWAQPTNDIGAKWIRAKRNLASAEIGSFKAGTGKVVYRIFQKEEFERNVVIFPGFGEAPHKYAEVITDFLDRRYNVFILSHRGMGESDRLLANPQIIHIDDAKVYYQDADYFLRRIVAPRVGDQPVYLYAHSAGGLIGAHALANNPGFFDKAVLNAPMFDINLHGLSRPVAWLIGQTRSPESYAPWSADWDPQTATFGSQTATGSMPRWWFANQNFLAYPKLRVGGPSTGWVLNMMAETRPGKIQALAARVKTPVLLFQAGDDTYVVPAAHSEFVKNCVGAKMKHFRTARHEIHNEREFIRHEAMDSLFKFFEN